MTAHEVIIRPIVTERSMLGMPNKVYTFEVYKLANKIQILKAIEEVFEGAKVEKIRTMHIRGKLRRQGRTQGYTRSWKKAIVTLTEDSKGIKFFEGMA